MSLQFICQFDWRQSKRMFLRVIISEIQHDAISLLYQLKAALKNSFIETARCYIIIFHIYVSLYFIFSEREKARDRAMLFLLPPLLLLLPTLTSQGKTIFFSHFAVIFLNYFNLTYISMSQLPNGVKSCRHIWRKHVIWVDRVFG